MSRILILSSLLFGLSITGAMAQQGDWMVRLRVVQVAPIEESSEVLPTFPGSSVSIEDITTPELDLTYFINDHWAIEGYIGLSTYSVNGEGTLAVFGKTFETKTFAPTVALQYHLQPDAKVRPYVGLGINHTDFRDEEMTTSVTDVFGPTTVELESSTGAFVQAGIDVALGGPWYVNADIKYIQVDTVGTLNSSGLINTVDVDINPVVFGGGVGYRF